MNQDMKKVIMLCGMALTIVWIICLMKLSFIGATVRHVIALESNTEIDADMKNIPLPSEDDKG